MNPSLPTSLPKYKVFVATCVAAIAVVALAAATGSSRTIRAHTASSAIVTIKNFMYMPMKLTVNPGTKVTFRNVDSTNHTVTANGGSFNVSNLAPGKSATVTFKKAGTYAYHCTFHPFMKATIVVR